MLAIALGLLIAPQAPDEPVFPATEAGSVIRLWEGDAPGALGDGEHDVPTITPFLPADRRGTGAAVVVFPGGGYGGLAGHEGAGYARWLNGYGIAAFVVRYRLGSHGYRHPAMLQDAARAVRTVRAQAGEWQLDPGRIGVMGSSAGGHLASTILTHWDRGDADREDPVERESSRPDFGILCYPVIGLGDELAHKGSRRNLLGDDPDPELVELLSNERQVTADTPPTFLWHTAEDGGVSVRNSYAFADALARAGVPHELHVYPHGRHGLGVGIGDPAGKGVPDLLPWTRACARWLAEVADGVAIGDGVPQDVVRRAERWAEELPRPGAGSVPDGVAPTLTGRVVARVGHAVAVRVDDDPGDLIESAVGMSAFCFRGAVFLGDGRIVERSGGFVIITLSLRNPGARVAIGDHFAIFGR